jgi:hypothetical protein
VVAVHVFHPPLEWWARSDPRSRWSKAKALFDASWVQASPFEDVRYEQRMVDDVDVRKGLIRGAVEAHCDALVVGMRSLSSRGTRVGGVAGEVAARSPIPVLAVPRRWSGVPWRADPARELTAAVAK